MDPITLSLLLVAVGIVLLVGELLLPTHGVLGIFGGLAIAGAIALTFFINRWLGLAILLLAIVASPFIWSVVITLWEKSPVGKRMILQPTEQQRRVIPVKIGQTGIAFSDLRPMGECDFGEQRLSAMSEHGIIHAGSSVRIVGVVNGMPTVRAVPAEALAPASTRSA